MPLAAHQAGNITARTVKDTITISASARRAAVGDNRSMSASSLFQRVHVRFSS
jgi:hypothetical protein